MGDNLSRLYFHQANIWYGLEESANCVVNGNNFPLGYESLCGRNEYRPEGDEEGIQEGEH